MDWYQILAQAGLVFLKEGINFVFSTFKDKREAEEAQIISEREAKTIVKKAIEEETNQVSQSIQSKVNWNKVGTLFWLGNDLMWIQDMMYRGAMPERVLQGFQIVSSYFDDLGFYQNSFPNRQLAVAQTILESLQGLTELTPEQQILLQQHYRTINQYISTLKWYVNALVEQQQPGFKKLRAR